MIENYLEKDDFQLAFQENLETASYADGLSLTSLFNDGVNKIDDCISFLSDAGQMLTKPENLP